MADSKFTCPELLGDPIATAGHPRVREESASQ